VVGVASDAHVGRIASVGVAERRVAAAVFASGSGSNLQALLDAEAAGAAPWTTRLVVSDREEAGALDRARAAGVETRVIAPTGTAGNDAPVGDTASQTLAALEGAGVEVVFLAGYLKLVPAPVVERFRNRMLNIHPALLPAFGGKGMWGRRVHEAVLSSGARITGPTVHLVDERYDEGRILAQWPVPVLADDTPASLAARVLAEEHRLYALAAAHLCRAVLEGRDVTPLDPPGARFEMAAGAARQSQSKRNPPES
jgi:formyltetrahydrofolate-dependent phosphoribosylglycinamide formyltransferase